MSRMDVKKPLLVAIPLFAASASFGSGFSLYEPSALSHAMGGALVGRALDASANFNNPATLSDLTNLTVTVGFVTEHPRCKVHVNGGGEEKLDPGLFWLPCFQLAVPLPFGFTFGLGADAEYGLGTKYAKSWSMNWSTIETTVEGYVLNPNLSYAITEDWSVGAGLRWLFFSFEQYSDPIAASEQLPYDLGSLRNHLKGDNDFKSLGWQIGTRYRIFDNFSVGAVYKSAIDVTVKGRCTTSVGKYNDPVIGGIAAATQTPADMIRAGIAQNALAANGDAEADLTLPQSVTAGFNWDITDTVHLGGAVSWTEWSTLDTLKFHLPNKDRPIGLNWHDTWRFAVAPSWDFAEDWTFMISYIYDMDCTDDHQESAMLPPADRHILGGGLTWRIWGGLECTLSYACIFMAGGDMETRNELGRNYHLKSSNGFCHAAGFSVTYRF